MLFTTERARLLRNLSAISVEADLNIRGQKSPHPSIVVDRPPVANLHLVVGRRRAAGHPLVVGQLPAVDHQFVADLRRAVDRPLPLARGPIRLLVVGHPRLT
jgi:hypothetical protein